MKTIKKVILAASISTVALAHSSFAADVTFRIHQFLPAHSNVPKLAIEPWAEKVESESEGRIEFQHFPSMQLGGRPQQLLDQARDGVVDIVWTALGYTPGRFPKSEVFELPFISPNNAELGSRAFYNFVQNHAGDEFKGLKVIAVHTAGPGIFHSKDPIQSLEDVEGTKIRGASRLVNMLLDNLGATPVGIPAPSIGEAMSKGVISAASLQWEAVPTLKLEQMVKNHTEFSGDKSLYTGTFAFVMNPQAYDKLPADLKAIIDKNSGEDTAALFGRAMDEGDRRGRSAVVTEGNNIITLDENETARWQEKTLSVRDSWIKEVKEQGIDGVAVIDAAEKTIKEHLSQ
ncbi:TRAP-type C4-dicarboxylate transport system substrate-binding protein [Marinobacterium sp. MBR-111]|jgi:TRAP-type C4-dicarboxylate transport system substrate-binding protein|uniref:TRAP transporter substrate-binding protein n=1 Tax=Marinobacterium sp. MBR-111 TaxID=3156463 RepID=UPI00339152C9